MEREPLNQHRIGKIARRIGKIAASIFISNGRDCNPYPIGPDEVQISSSTAHDVAPQPPSDNLVKVRRGRLRGGIPKELLTGFTTDVESYSSARGFVSYLNRLTVSGEENVRERVALLSLVDCRQAYANATQSGGILRHLDISPERYGENVKSIIDFDAEYSNVLWQSVADFRVMTLTLGSYMDEPIAFVDEAGIEPIHTISPGLIEAYSAIGSHLTNYAMAIDLRNRDEVTWDTVINVTRRVSQAVNPTAWGESAFLNESGEPIVPSTDVSAGLYLNSRLQGLY